MSVRGVRQKKPAQKLQETVRRRIRKRIPASQKRPKEPLTGPLSLSVLWLFPKGKSHKAGEWRVTRPDTDNLEKTLKDCMTHCGFWKDDAQVVREHVEKKWSEDPVGIEIEITELEVSEDEPLSE